MSKRSKNRWNPAGLTAEGQTALVELCGFHAQQVSELGSLYEHRLDELRIEYAQARQALADTAERTVAEIREKHAA